MRFLPQLHRQSQTSDRRRRNASKPRKSSFSPRVEGLEDRDLLSAMSVVNTDDSGPGSLRQAIIDANEQEGADVITFAESVQGTISLTSGQLAITDELTIDGPGADVLTISGGGNSRVFLVGGATVAIDEVTIADGVGTDLIADNPDLAWYAAGGGLLNLSGNVTVSDVHLTGNTAQGFLGTGGGIGNYFGGQLTVNQSSFEENSVNGFAWSFGGAISNYEASTLTINDSTFSGNTLNVGSGRDPDRGFSGMAGGAVIAGGNGSAINVTNSQFDNNNANAGDGLEGTGQGGGISIGGAISLGNNSFIGAPSQSTLHVSGSVFSGNQAVGGKGADGVSGGNGGPAYGGAINVNSGAAATFVESEFIGNKIVAGNGGNGGAGADGGDSGVYGTSFDGVSGGAISAVGSGLTIVDSTFSENVVQGGDGGRGGNGGNGGNATEAVGGALNLHPWAPGAANSVEVTNTSITNQIVIAGKGGQAGEGGTDGADARAVGGGLYIGSKYGTPDVTVSITDSSVTGNTVQGTTAHSSGILADIGATLTLANVDVSGNTSVSDGVEVASDDYACEGILTSDDNCVAPQQGDANMDGQFDRQDIEQVLQAGKYGTDEDAVWSEGDWNRDGRFDQADIIAALQTNNYVA